MCRIRKFIHNPKIQSELFFTFWYTFGIHFDQHGFELPGFTYLYVDFFSIVNSTTWSAEGHMEG